MKKFAFMLSQILGLDVKDGFNKLRTVCDQTEAAHVLLYKVNRDMIPFFFFFTKLFKIAIRVVIYAVHNYRLDFQHKHDN